MSVEDDNCSSLEEVILSRNVPAVENLLKSGISLDFPQSNGSYLQLATEMSLRKSNQELVHLLLYYNAQVYNDGAIQSFALATRNNNPKIQRLLFDYIFDGYASIPLEIILYLVRLNKTSNLILRIISGTYNIYNTGSWDDLYHDLELFKSNDFELFMVKFPGVVLEAVKNGEKDCSILCLAKFISHQWIRNRIAKDAIHNLLILLAHDEIVEFLREEVSEPWFCLLAPLPLEILEILVYQSLSVGFDIYDVDINAIFKSHGWCELFRNLLHMDVKIPDQDYVTNLIKVGYLSEGKYDSIATLTYQIDCAVEEFAGKSRNIKCIYRYENLLDFTRHVPETTEVPSLLELARNRTRHHLIDHYKIRKSWQYQLVIKRLFIPEIIREILTFERNLYKVSKTCPDSRCLTCYDRHLTDHDSSSYSSSDNNSSPGSEREDNLI